MQLGRSFWAIPVLAALSTPAASLTGAFSDDDEVVITPSVSLASATTADFYISAPGVEGPPASLLTGLLLETFDAGQVCSGGTTIDRVNNTVLAVGTISATSGVSLRTDSACWGGAATTSATPMPLDTYTDIYDFPTTSAYPRADMTPFAYPHAGAVTVNLMSPVNYVGLYWAAGSANNVITVKSGATTVATFNTSDLMNLIPDGGTVTANGGSTYQNNYYHGGRKGAWRSWSNPQFRDPEPFLFLSIVAPSGTFDQIILSGSGFEFDNLSIGTYSGTFDTTGLVSVPRNSYSITYNAQGGSSVPSGLYTAGSTVTVAAAPTRAGFEFAGWFTSASGGNLLGTTYAPPGTGNITLYAQWRSIVTFDPNGGTGTSVTQSATGNTALTGNNYTRAGYTFAGWNTTTSGTGTNYLDGATFNFTAPTTLYAQWTEVPAAGNGAQLPLVTLPVATVAPSRTTPSTTTAPSTTVPSTTAPSTTLPAPIPDTAGALPTMQSGESLVTDNGTPVPIEVFLDDTSTLVMRGQDFQLNLAGDCADGCTVISDQTGRETIQLEQDGNALVDGFGFMPGTLVHIWMFSEPTYLGSLLVADDGTFQGSVYLEGIAPGTHTLQVNGTSFDGNDRSANLGVIVTANAQPTPPLPATGGGNTAPQLVLAALAMVMLGALARRRT